MDRRNAVGSHPDGEMTWAGRSGKTSVKAWHSAFRRELNQFAGGEWHRKRQKGNGLLTRRSQPAHLVWSGRAYRRNAGRPRLRGRPAETPCPATRSRATSRSVGGPPGTAAPGTARSKRPAPLSTGCRSRWTPMIPWVRAFSYRLGGTKVYRIRVHRKPKPYFNELTADLLEAIPTES